MEFPPFGVEISDLSKPCSFQAKTAGQASSKVWRVEPFAVPSRITHGRARRFLHLPHLEGGAMSPLQVDTAAMHAASDAPAPQRLGWRGWYLRVLTWAFMLLTAARLVAYLPTAWAIVQTRDSSQHSLWTWLIWVGANLTMAAWLYEHNGHRIDKAIGVSLANAAACGLTVGVILWFR
jgi:hypothetical protein